MTLFTQAKAVIEGIKEPLALKIYRRQALDFLQQNDAKELIRQALEIFERDRGLMNHPVPRSYYQNFGLEVFDLTEDVIPAPDSQLYRRDQVWLAVNTAFFQGGLGVRIPAGRDLTSVGPLAFPLVEKALPALYKSILFLETGSSVEISETCTASKRPQGGLRCPFSVFQLGSRTKLVYSIYQHWSARICNRQISSVVCRDGVDLKIVEAHNGKPDQWSSLIFHGDRPNLDWQIMQISDGISDDKDAAVPRDCRANEAKIWRVHQRGFEPSRLSQVAQGSLQALLSALNFTPWQQRQLLLREEWGDLIDLLPIHEQIELTQAVLCRLAPT